MGAYHMRAARIDKNQPAIVDALRKMGASVQILSTVGDGFPDLAVGINGRNYLVEVKYEDGKLTPDQVKWHSEWKGQKVVIRGIGEAINFLRSCNERG